MCAELLGIYVHAFVAETRKKNIQVYQETHSPLRNTGVAQRSTSQVVIDGREMRLHNSLLHYIQYVR